MLERPGNIAYGSDVFEGGDMQVVVWAQPTDS